MFINALNPGTEGERAAAISTTTKTRAAIA